MRVTIYQILFCLTLITPVMSRAQNAQTSIEASLLSGSNILIDTYLDNITALHQLDSSIRENKSMIISTSGYIQLMAGIPTATISDKYALNIAATQASVVRNYIKAKYCLTDRHFSFCFDENTKVNTVQISINEESVPQSGSKNIFFNPNKSSEAVNAAIASYGTHIPTRNINTSTMDTKSNASTRTTPQTDSNTTKDYRDSYSIDFRYGSETLYAAYMNNKRTLEHLKSNIHNNRPFISEQKQHMRIVSVIPESEKGNMAAINFASIRGAIVRQWLRDIFPWLSDSDFSFFISTDDSNRNVVEVSFIDSPVDDKHTSDIFFSLNKGYPEKVDYAAARYKRIPFLNGSQMFERTGMDFKIIDPTLDPSITKRIEGVIDEQIIITIYYRWDKDNLDRTYLTNTQTISQIDSLFQLKSADYIDSLRIVAYASPEGPPDYNKRLSERRANTLKNYLLSTYPHLREEQVITVAKGENWDGFRRMAQADPKLPMKEQVLSIIDNPNITDLQRQSQIAKLDGGRLYKNYILPNYYRYLRTGASLFVIYNPGKPVDIDFEPIEVILVEPEPEAEPIVIVEPKPIEVVERWTITKYPIALRTNLLYDVVGALNIGIEMPLIEGWSWILDGAYSYWRSPKNLYALQTLEYGTEFRYWFGASESRKDKNPNWDKPLKGWNIGVYGRYWQRYDVQRIDGFQGDDTWSAGFTVNYAFPIGKQLSFEAGIGAGWLSTSEYRHYHQPEYDRDSKYRLMWQETGRQSGLSLTKVRFALVWLIQTSKTQERKITP